MRHFVSVRVQISRSALTTALQDCERQKLEAIRHLQSAHGDLLWLEEQLHQQQLHQQQASPKPDAP